MFQTRKRGDSDPMTDHKVPQQYCFPSFESVCGMLVPGRVWDPTEYLNLKDLVCLCATNRETFELFKDAVERLLWVNYDRPTWSCFKPRNIIFSSIPLDRPIPDYFIGLRFGKGGRLPPLPPTLKTLDLLAPLDRYEDLEIPRRVEWLRISYCIKGLDAVKLPSGLKTLVIYWGCGMLEDEHLPAGTFDNLPPFLETLRFECNVPYNHPLDRLPLGLRSLTLPGQFNKPIDHLPSGLQELFVGYSFNQPVDNLPVSLEILDLRSEFNHPVDHLPPNLKDLDLGSYFNHPVNKLPKGLETLTLRKKFDQPIAGLLPNSLQMLELGRSFSYSLGVLPSGLERLILHHRYASSVQRYIELQNLFMRGWRVVQPPESLDSDDEYNCAHHVMLKRHE